MSVLSLVFLLPCCFGLLFLFFVHTVVIFVVDNFKLIGALYPAAVGVFTGAGHIGPAFYSGNGTGVHGAIFGRLSQWDRGGVRAGFRQLPVGSFWHGWDRTQLNLRFSVASGSDLTGINLR